MNICNEKNMNCAMMLTISNHYGTKSLCILLWLEQCLKWFLTWLHIGIICEILFLLQLISAMENENECVFMFIIGNHYGIKCLSNLLQIEPYNIMFKVIPDIMEH